MAEPKKEVVTPKTNKKVTENTEKAVEKVKEKKKPTFVKKKHKLIKDLNSIPPKKKGDFVSVTEKGRIFLKNNRFIK